MKTPRISILIPARNEEKELPFLLRSIENLSYPKAQMQVLLGNDQSEDKTGEIMNRFAESKNWVEVIEIKDSDSGLKGKTKVLAELAKKATGEYLFFTDADIRLPKSWIEGMVSEFSEPDMGVVVGVTGMKKDKFWSAMQGIEWLMALSINKILSDFNIPTTGMGNNMAVSKKAYDTIGGYESIGFSIVEDYHLYRNIIDKGYGFKQAFKNEVLAFTVPPNNYFEQRKRWIQGGFENSPAPMIGGLLQAFSIPILLIISYFNVNVSLVIIGILLFTYSFFILFFERKLKIKGYLKFLPAFAIYVPIAWFLQINYYILRKKTVWKGRTY